MWVILSSLKLTARMSHKHCHMQNEPEPMFPWHSTAEIWLWLQGMPTILRGASVHCTRAQEPTSCFYEIPMQGYGWGPQGHFWAQIGFIYRIPRKKRCLQCLYDILVQRYNLGPHGLLGVPHGTLMHCTRVQEPTSCFYDIPCRNMSEVHSNICGPT